jgi:hypothetical protein
VVKLFLSNLHLLSTPILVIAQTNHALDNILEPVLDFARELAGCEGKGNEMMLRVGGGSKSVEISKVTQKAKKETIKWKRYIEVSSDFRLAIPTISYIHENQYLLHELIINANATI